MPSTYTTSLALQLMATGENAGTWGQITNTNLTLVQQAISGYQDVSIAGGAQTTALVMTQNALANARNIVIKLSGAITGNQIVTIPNNVTKTWIVSNGTTGAFTVQFKYASTGTGITWSTTDKSIKILYADGTDIRTVDLSTLSGQIVAAQITTSTITKTQLAASAVVANNIAASTITASKMAASSIYANQIVQSTITQTKLAADSVGPNQLQSTAVTPGSYTAASITVDADGRITAASSGSAGAGGFVPKVFASGPSSGTYTASTGTTRILAYMYAGGGRGRGPNTSGGGGGYGAYNVPVAGPFSAWPYSVGAGGNNSGAAGGATNLTNIGTVNGGNGAPSPNVSGNPGTQPGVSLTGYARQFIAGYYSVTGYQYCGGATAFGVDWGGGATDTPNYFSGPGCLLVFENTGT